MARPKGSKNAVRTKKANIDYAAIVAEKTAAKEQIETEIAALSDNISVLKEQLKSQKTALKAVTKELSKAEAKKVAAEKKAAEESKKAEAESVLKKLLASGMSADDIIARLQYTICNFFSFSNVSKLKWHIIFLFRKSLPFSDRRLLL